MTSTGQPSGAQRLRSSGLRVTAPRQAVLEVVELHQHADVDTILRATRKQLGSVSVQAVYDVLRALGEARLLRRVEPAGSPARYEVDRGDNHHHLACRCCGSLQDVDCATGTSPCLDPATLHGFAVDEAEVIYWGLCHTCQAHPHQDTTYRQTCRIGTGATTQGDAQ